MKTFSALLVLCEGNPPVTNGLSSHRASDVELWCFLWCQPEWTVEQTVDRQVNWDVLMSIWRYSNVYRHILCVYVLIEIPSECSGRPFNTYFLKSVMDSQEIRIMTSYKYTWHGNAFRVARPLCGECTHLAIFNTSTNEDIGARSRYLRQG